MNVQNTATRGPLEPTDKSQNPEIKSNKTPILR